MNLVQPAALWALATVPLILALYILRPRHRRLVVPSIRLWQQLPSDLEGRPRWRLPVSSLLLIAQLAIAAAIAFALARPAIPGAIRQHLIVLLDTSPTMAATDVSPNRLGLAISDARALTNSLSKDDFVTLITIEPSPRILASGKGPEALDQALPGIVTAPQRGDFNAAMLLASQTAQLSRDTHNRVVILSDGASSTFQTNAIGSIPADVSFQQVGGSDDNQGITALSVRPMIGSANRYVGFVQVANYAHQDVKVSFVAYADGLQLDREQLALPSRGHVELSLPLPVGSRHVEVSLAGHDSYASDDRAQILVPDSQKIPVTVVGTDTGYWERAFKTNSSVSVTVVSPGNYKPDNAVITVFDQFVPASLPTSNVVLVAPPTGNPIVDVTGDISDADVVHQDPTTPLFASIDLAGMYLPKVTTFGSTPWAAVLADSSKGPIMLDGIVNGRRVVVVGFDPAATDWPQRPSFPVFVANLVDNVVTSPIPTEVDAGKVLDLPPSPTANNVLVQLPNGKVDVFNQVDRPIRFTDTGQLGRYTVTYAAGQNPIARHEFVVSRLGLSESSILPLVDATQLAKLGSPEGRPSEHDVWPWVAGGILALLSLEWVAFFNRQAI